jgi:hypothetical protein
MFAGFFSNPAWVAFCAVCILIGGAGGFYVGMLYLRRRDARDRLAEIEQSALRFREQILGMYPDPAPEIRVLPVDDLSQAQWEWLEAAP